MTPTPSAPAPDPPIISLDCETYGAYEKTHDGRPLPNQNYFHPARCLWQDKIPLSDLVHIVTITIPERDPRPHGKETPWTAALIGELRPGPTFRLLFHNPLHRRILREWLKYADTILGMNFLFDGPFLRAYPEFGAHLDGRHTIIDMSVVNYLHSELRPEKSLKALGPILGQYTYKRTLKGEDGETQKFPNVLDPEGLDYASQDPHNTILGISQLCRWIVAHFKDSAKQRPQVWAYYSDLAWSAIRMMEAGVPISITGLLHEEARLASKSADAAARCLEAGLVVGAEHGESPVASKRTFLEPLAAALPPSYSAGPGYTPQQKALSLNDKNRLLITDYFESQAPDSPHLPILEAWDTSTKSEKLISSYTSPLLRGPRRRPDAPAPAKLKEIHWSTPSSPSSPSPPSSSSPAPPSPRTRHRVGLGFPRIYLTPGAFKDGAGDSGGQQQCRISFKDPAVQTFPHEIKQWITSRYGAAGRILSWDASQVELRVAGLISGDSFILSAYNEGRDLHRETAIKTFGASVLDDPDFDKKFRQPAKHANFTKLNLGGAAVLQKTLLKKAGIRVSLSFCEHMVAEGPRVNPELHAWQQRIIAEARSKGRFELPILGQSRFFSPDEKPNEIVNFPIQGLAATLTNYVMIRVHQTMPPLNARNPRWHLFVNWYDAIFVDAHASVVEEAKAVVEAAIAHTISTYWASLESHYGRRCPMKYGFTIHPYKEPPECPPPTSSVSPSSTPPSTPTPTSASEPAKSLLSLPTSSSTPPSVP